jgi:putative ABC transport system ATP-binding protein
MKNDLPKNVLISINHVWKQKKVRDNGKVIDLPVLNGVTVDFCGGCVQMIVGPSGSGKTTLLRLLNKLETPDRGKIFYNQVDLASVSSRQLRKEIGMVFQTPALFRGTVIDNIVFGPRLFDDHVSVAMAEKYLNVVGLTGIELSRNIDTLSVGQQQRVSFARALANEPKVLLLDEPTSALDPSAAKNLLDLVQKINRQFGISIIMVTHVMEHARRISDTICLLHEGRIIESGPTATFFDNPETEIAKKFIAGEL